jgi:hypothetical protein
MRYVLPGLAGPLFYAELIEAQLCRRKKRERERAANTVG